jgi:exopolysaccharide biosynthesis protein
MVLVRCLFGFACYLLLMSMQPLAKGAWYEHRILPGPLSIHLLEIDPVLAEIRPVHAGDKILSLEKTSSLARRFRAFAAVNGSFFRMWGTHAGTSSWHLKIDQQWMSFSSHKRGAIGWGKGGNEAMIDRLEVKGSLVVEQHSFPIDALNQPRSDHQAVLYSWQFDESSKTTSKGNEVGIDHFHTIRFSKPSYNEKLPFQGWIYSLGPQCTYNFPLENVGKKTTISIQAYPLMHPDHQDAWEHFDHIVGGTPVLIDCGEIVPDFQIEKVHQSFLDKRHARTAIGIKPNGHWIFVVVDGRQPELSIGMTMNELAQLMKELGCHSALNLDGGGSSTFVLNGQVVNSPYDEEDTDSSDTGERAVGDAILIFLKFPYQVHYF